MSRLHMTMKSSPCLLQLESLHAAMKTHHSQKLNKPLKKKRENIL